MPQKMLTPSWWPIMLWIISVNSTVLPTPAPPNRPALPPRSSGTSRSITLIPVANTSERVERLAIGGGRQAVDGGAEDIEHARQDGRAHRRLQRHSGVAHRHAARQALGRRQRD